MQLVYGDHAKQDMKDVVRRKLHLRLEDIVGSLKLEAGSDADHGFILVIEDEATECRDARWSLVKQSI